MEIKFEAENICGDIEFEIKQMEAFAADQADTPVITYGYGEILTLLCC